MRCLLFVSSNFICSLKNDKRNCQESDICFCEKLEKFEKPLRNNPQSGIIKLSENVRFVWVSNSNVETVPDVVKSVEFFSRSQTCAASNNVFDHDSVLKLFGPSEYNNLIGWNSSVLPCAQICLNKLGS